MTETAHLRWLGLRGVGSVPGYLPGFRQPAALINLDAPAQEPSIRALSQLDRCMADLFPGHSTTAPPKSVTALSSIGIFARAICAALAAEEIPLFSTPVCLQPSRAATATTVGLLIPALGEDAGLFRTLAAILIEIGEKLLEGSAIDSLGDRRDAMIKAIRSYRPSGINSHRFLRAANAANIPWRRISGNIFGFGWGSQSRWLDSSFTDRTSVIAANIAHNKQTAAKVLRRAGIPVPQHARVFDAAQAVRVAEALGYPVVVKPADQEGGRGVTADLRKPEEVILAFTKASSQSKNVLVEAHIEGRDYRLQVFGETVYWAIRRDPAHVIGDGIQNVAALIAEKNTDPMRGPPGSNALLKHIIIDEEAETWLTRQGLSLNMVPAAGRMVRLRGAANIASGGQLTPVLEEAHPDNLELAVRAARVLRLDLAGIDLLIPDISRSWREGGAAICEVNAQPQLSPHLQEHLLGQIVAGKGRIPVAVIFGKADDASWLPAIEKSLRTEGRRLGIANASEASIEGLTVTMAQKNAFTSTSALLDDRRVDALLIHVTDTSFLLQGCPVDAIDQLIIAGQVEGSPQASTAIAQQLAQRAWQCWSDADRSGTDILADSLGLPIERRKRASELSKILSSGKINS